jgi:hypothetical protein
MFISNIFSSKLIGDHPRIELNNPKLSEDGAWLVSGKVIVEFFQGPSVPADKENFEKGNGLAIAVPFSDAENEHAAILQAAQRLRQISSEIAEIASALQSLAEQRGKVQHNPT